MKLSREFLNKTIFFFIWILFMLSLIFFDINNLTKIEIVHFIQLYLLIIILWFNKNAEIKRIISLVFLANLFIFLILFLTLDYISPKYYDHLLFFILTTVLIDFDNKETLFAKIKTTEITNKVLVPKKALLWKHILFFTGLLIIYSSLYSWLDIEKISIIEIFGLSITTLIVSGLWINKNKKIEKILFIIIFIDIIFFGLLDLITNNVSFEFFLDNKVIYGYWWCFDRFTNK